jgi:hypothetical protein
MPTHWKIYHLDSTGIGLHNIVYTRFVVLCLYLVLFALYVQADRGGCRAEGRGQEEHRRANISSRLHFSYFPIFVFTYLVVYLFGLSYIFFLLEVIINI